MFFFWLFFILIAVAGILTHRRTAKEAAPLYYWNTKTMEAILRYATLIICSLMLVYGVLGMLGLVGVR